jgi:hypothetical protein
MKKRATLEDWLKAGARVQEANPPILGRLEPEPSLKERMQALGRLRTGEMNQTEKRYAQYLELQKVAGDVLWWAFEPLNLRLGHNCFYRVDFLVLKSTGVLECHEVKGHWTDDALVKIRVAAGKFPFQFIAVRWVKKDWEYRNF